MGGRKRQLEIRLCLVVQRVIDWRHRRPLANVAESSESPGGERGDDAPVDQIFAILGLQTFDNANIETSG